MRVRRRAAWWLLPALAMGACQNWDLLRPSETSADGRSFTRLEDSEPRALTNAVALERIQEIQAAEGRARLELVDAFFGQFPRARMIGEVHRLAGEAHLALGDTAAAAEAFERALLLTRTDLLGLPLEIDLPLQVAMTQLAAGRTDEGLRWLARVSMVDAGERTQQALHWAHAQYGEGPFERWVDELTASARVAAPGFELPGLQKPTLALPADAGEATLINFWSPT